MAASRGFDEPQPARTTTASRATTAQIGRAHAELQSQSNLVCRLLLEKKNAVRIDEASDHDVVVEKAHRFRIVAAHQLILQFDQLLCAENFAGVQTAADPNDRLPFPG